MFKKLTISEFIKDHWQQSYYFEAAVCHDLQNLITGDELAELACDEDVVSRIVTGNAHYGQWTSRYGPFVSADFSRLPGHDWTLLVESVDHVIPKIKKIFERFVFLPRWRTDDIMISYAATGGGVGPHFDYYDVFLIQLSGVRRWRLGQTCHGNSELLANDQIKLLNKFEGETEIEAGPGDVLYVPAGTAHWGRAHQDNCITLSVGFRAPSQAEILTAAMDLYVQGLPDNRRYSDSINAIDHNPFKINHAAFSRIEQMTADIASNHWQESVREAFGQLVTETIERPDEVAIYTMEQLAEKFKLKNPIEIMLSDQSRFAFDSRHLYVNGQSFAADEQFSKTLLEGEVSWPLPGKLADLLLQLINHGHIALID